MRRKIKLLSLHPQSRNNDSMNDLVAQLVEQMTLNHWVESSSLSGVTKKQSAQRRLLFSYYSEKRTQTALRTEISTDRIHAPTISKQLPPQQANRFSPCQQIPILYLAQKINPAKKISKTYQEFSYIWKTICPNLFYTMDKNSHCWAEERNKQ